MTPNVHYDHRELEDERLELSKGGIYWLGPNITLRRCTLVIGVEGRWLTLMSGRLIDCTIEAKREFNDARWTTMGLKGCRFKGRFSGNEFGYREEYQDPWKLGGMEDCDFSEARLDLCRFHSCDMETIHLPKWPSFTIVDPIKYGPELLSVPWPGDFTPVILQGPLKELPSTSALTFYAPAEAKRSGATLEEFKAAVERFDFIMR
ncbi:hypothetical protein [Melittangium boletus]|uniref:Pentapeptide repeat-containing protein n=1 Tax=Melittangium boletus DSM 14713 TaxID=1294270 RepID=A0A250IDQ9_9BACT|nr:hypothetical protein [Melittangium boletus]ATB29994.1 hypothetical protein MEBOL_003449 [Melittangium boletus DSM 14713]